MRKIISLALLVLIVGALLVTGCQKTITTAPPVGEAIGSEDQQIAKSIDDLNDLEIIDQNLDAELQELDNLNLE